MPWRARTRHSLFGFQPASDSGVETRAFLLKPSPARGSAMRPMMTLAAMAFGAVGALMSAAPARVQDCTTTCSRYEEGECVEHMRMCKSSPEGGTVARHQYGAIAFGRASHAWGISERWGTLSQADSAAMARCRENGAGCEVMVWFDRRCGAVAAGRNATAFWGLGLTESRAKAAALASCVKGGGQPCTPWVWHCSP
jgi:hypothetical protein